MYSVHIRPGALIAEPTKAMQLGRLAYAFGVAVDLT